MKFSKLCVLMAAVLLAVLSCRSAGAAQFSSYFRIAKDYATNEEEARKTWIGKEISIEGNVLVSGPNEEGNLVVALAAESLTLSYDVVVYAFMFDGVPEESAIIEKGHKVRITGTLKEIEKEFWDQKNVLDITVSSSKLVQAQTEDLRIFSGYRITQTGIMTLQKECGSARESISRVKFSGHIWTMSEDSLQWSCMQRLGYCHQLMRLGIYSSSTAFLTK